MLKRKRNTEGLYIFVGVVREGIREDLTLLSGPNIVKEWWEPLEQAQQKELQMKGGAGGGEVASSDQGSVRNTCYQLGSHLDVTRSSDEKGQSHTSNQRSQPRHTFFFILFSYHIFKNVFRVSSILKN